MADITKKEKAKEIAADRAKQNIKKVWDKTYVRAYWPNFFRYEEIDDEHWSYVIYIDNEEVERCPMNASRAEVDMRFHELLAERGIEDDNMYVRKERN